MFSLRTNLTDMLFNKASSIFSFYVMLLLYASEHSSEVRTSVRRFRLYVNQEVSVIMELV